MASVEEVEGVLDALLAKVGKVDERKRSRFPSTRTIEARCPDIEHIRYARWHDGAMTLLDHAPANIDIRLRINSDDLLEIAAGRLSFGRAYTSGRLKLEASMSDLIRLGSML